MFIYHFETLINLDNISFVEMVEKDTKYTLRFISTDSRFLEEDFDTKELAEQEMQNIISKIPASYWSGL